MSTKEKVLQLLKNSEEVLSGEKMAQTLAVSRTSIWKAIKTLEKTGYQIAHEANGYRLLVEADLLDAQVIREQFTPEVSIEAIQVLANSESTQLDARQATMTENPVTTLVVADTQNAAKGRFGRPFAAQPSKGIYMSLLLNPQKVFAELPQYTVVMAVAVAKAIDKLAAKNTQIKWVNDIYLDGKKVCGILSEAMSDVETMQISHIIIGVGINVSIKQADFGPELQQKATSIFPDGQATFARNELIAEVMNQFYYYLDKPAETIRSYREKSFVLGKQVGFTRQGIDYVGKAVDITDLGELVVAINGQKQLLSSGEISLSAIQ